MKNPLVRLRRLFALAGVGVAAAVAAPADAAAQLPDNLPEEVSEYRLTEANLQKFIRATRNLEALEEQDIEVDNPLEGRDPEDVDFDEIVAAMDEHPQVSAALRDAGMDGREFFTFVFAMMQAMFGSIAVEIGGEEALDDMEDGVLKENIRFIIAHRDELEALGRDDDEG